MIRTIGIVSLSRGILGEGFMHHELDIGVKRLQDYGVRVKFLPHALDGLESLAAHPEHRAQDLLDAFRDPEIDAILCAIGGDDTYRLAPYLFSNNELQNAVTKKPFLGFSDTTLNHFMLHKVGLPTFYGQAFLPDVCELAPEMLPYTRQYLEEFLKTGTIREVRPSSVWYESRKEFGPDQVGTELPVHKNTGFELLQGPAQFEGEILGGCIDSMYEMFSGWRHADMPDVCKTYSLFPDLDDWRGKILLLESCEEYMPPETYKKALETLKDTGVFDVVSGVLVGKPMDEVYAAEYKKLLAGVIANKELPIVCNLNIGHALPRCILPFGVRARVDAGEQVIRFGCPASSPRPEARGCAAEICGSLPREASAPAAPRRRGR